jgi:hypothetical protein
MALTIVWRNPFSSVRFSRTLKRIISNELARSVFSHCPGSHAGVEVIPGDLAGTRRLILLHETADAGLRGRAQYRISNEHERVKISSVAAVSGSLAQCCCNHWQMPGATNTQLSR